LSKPFRDQDLLDAVQQALDRSRVLRQEQEAMAALQARFDSLTPRERQVMGRIVAGLLNKQIAYDLGLSEATVKIHRGRVMERRAAASVADRVRRAEGLGIRPTPWERDNTKVGGRQPLSTWGRRSTGGRSRGGPWSPSATTSRSGSRSSALCAA